MIETFGPLGLIKLIKIDAEGAEAAVLRGLGSKLNDVDYLVIECKTATLDQMLAERNWQHVTQVDKENHLFKRKS